MKRSKVKFALILLFCSSSLPAQTVELPRYTSVAVDAAKGEATVTVEESLIGKFAVVESRAIDRQQDEEDDWITMSSTDDVNYSLTGRGHFEIRFSNPIVVNQTTTPPLVETTVVWRQGIYVPYPSPENIEGLARSYLPVPIFNAQEEYFPVSLDKIVDYGDAELEQIAVSRMDSDSPSRVRAGEELRIHLAHNGHSDNGIFFEQDDVTCPRQDEVQEPESDCSPVFYRNLRGDPQDVTVYYDASLEADSLYLTYYYFYAFDPKVEGGNPTDEGGNAESLNDFSHVYDRESVTIRFDRDTETDPWSPSFITYAAHLESQDMEFNGCSDFISCEGPAKGLVNDKEYVIWGGGKTTLPWQQALKVGNHPVVYLARGSHAVLPAAGWYTVRTTAVGQFLNEPAGGVGDTALVIPQASMQLSRLDYGEFPFLSFSGSWINVPLPILGYTDDGRGYFPPFIRTPYSQWLQNDDHSFSTCWPDPAPSDDCGDSVATYFEGVRGLENYAAVIFRVLYPEDESVAPVLYRPLAGAELRILEDGQLLDGQSYETTSLGEYSLIFQPDSFSDYTYEVWRDGSRVYSGQLNGLEMGVIAAEEIYLSSDSDDDGVANADDAFPDDPEEQYDTDGDGIGNNADIDDDGDVVPDEFDVFPLDSSEWSDYDSDGVGDNADPPEGAATVRVEILSTDTLNVYWTMPDGYTATSYELYRNEVSALTTEKLSFIDSGLNADTYYCYSVVATIETGEVSPPSSLSCAKTNSSSVPVSVTASAGNTQAVIAWDAVADAVAYAVYWSGESGVSLATANRVVVDAETYLHEGLVNNQAYFYVVTSLVDGRESTKSAEVIAVPRDSSLLNKFLFTSQRDGNWEIYSADAPSGDNMINLTVNPADDQLPKIPPTLGRIAFVSDRDGNSEVYAMEVDGTNQARFTDNLADDAPSDWSPDASELLVLTNRDNNLEIYKFSADGLFLARLTDNTEDDTLATWAPDGSRILYVSEVDGNPEIYTMLPNGEDKRNLTNHLADDNIPFYSPDGSQITFVSDRDGDYDLYIMNADGTNLRKLTGDEIDEVGWYAWSPDGSRIVYDSRSDGDYEIYMISENGTVSTRLTDNDFADQFASWTLDGRSILFVTDRDGNSEIYIVDSEGGDAVNVTNDPSEDFIAVFSPVYGPINCFIATAAYGSFLHQDIHVLRDFRDKRLMKTEIGRVLVDLYYSVSPPIAAHIAEREWLRAVTRGVLAPIVYSVKYPAGGLLLLGVVLLTPIMVRRRRVRRRLIAE